MKIPNRANALRRLLAGADLERLRELHAIFLDHFKLIRAEENEQIASQLKVGTRVTFAGKASISGPTEVYGSVEKVMRTRALVQERERGTGRPLPGRKWRVSLSILKVADDSTPDKFPNLAHCTCMTDDSVVCPIHGTNRHQ